MGECKPSQGSPELGIRFIILLHICSILEKLANELSFSFISTIILLLIGPNVPDNVAKELSFSLLTSTIILLLLIGPYVPDVVKKLSFSLLTSTIILLLIGLTSTIILLLLCEVCFLVCEDIKQSLEIFLFFLNGGSISNSKHGQNSASDEESCVHFSGFEAVPKVEEK
jgi:hypothetical protein